MSDIEQIIDAASTATSSKRERELEKQVADLSRELHRARKPRLRITPAAIRSTNDQFIRVIIPDTHGCYLDHGAAAALFADLEILQPTEIVMLGDHLDCGGFLAQHHTLGFVADAGYSYADDIAACNQFLDQLQQTCPRARIDYLYGNHEERVEKWCVTEALRNERDAERLRQQNSPEHVLSLATRGISYYRSNIRYDGLSVPGTIKRGHCYFTHGHRHGKHAAHAHVSQFSGNVVFGHIHRIQSHATRTVHGGTACAWSVGCLCELQPSYRNRDQTDWCHGYGVQFCEPSGKFTHITAHIIEGQSLLIPFVRAMGGG